MINLENTNEIERVLNDFCPPVVDGEFSLAKYLEQIDTCFSASTIEEILLNLEIDGSDWARQTIKVSLLLEIGHLLHLKYRFFQLKIHLIFYFRNFVDYEHGIADLFEIDAA